MKLIPFGDELRNLLEDLLKELYELEEANIRTASFETYDAVETAGISSEGSEWPTEFYA